ncbi:hypothetical protein JNJ66_01870 [Candidatus Saccharibacteria bacterium]|nr:hypothetical protein [Candidatus Saccharibacteria bacterium]
MGFDLGGIADKMSDAGKFKEVWDTMQEKNWGGLIESIQKVRGEKGDDEMLDKAEERARQAQAEGKEFPGSPGDFLAMIKQ